MGQANKLGMAEQRMLQIGGRLVWKHVQAYPGQMALFKGLVQYVQILDQCTTGKVDQVGPTLHVLQIFAVYQPTGLRSG